MCKEEKEKEKEENLSKSHDYCPFNRSICRFFYTGDLFDDDELSSEGDVSHVGFASSAVQDLEDEARSIMAKGAGANTIATSGNLALPFHVPHDTDPSIWSVRMKVSVLLSACLVLTDDGQPGKEANVVL